MNKKFFFRGMYAMFIIISLSSQTIGYNNRDYEGLKWGTSIEDIQKKYPEMQPMVWWYDGQVGVEYNFRHSEMMGEYFTNKENKISIYSELSSDVFNDSDRFFVFFDNELYKVCVYYKIDSNQFSWLEQKLQDSYGKFTDIQANNITEFIKTTTIRKGEIKISKNFQIKYESNVNNLYESDSFAFIIYYNPIIENEIDSINSNKIKL